MLTERNKLALSGSLALAIGLVVGAGLRGGADTKESREDRNVAVGEALAAGSAIGPSDVVDAEAYHATIREARDDDPTAVDLMSAPVDPGAEVLTGVTIDKGRHTTGVVEFIGPNAGDFEAISVTHTDKASGVWVEVKARNTGKAAARLIGFVHVEPAP